MQEEKSNISEGSVKIVCICGHCGYHDHEEATLQFDFGNKKILYVCPKCKKLNDLLINPIVGGYPRVGRMK